MQGREGGTFKGYGKGNQRQRMQLRRHVLQKDRTFQRGYRDPQADAVRKKLRPCRRRRNDAEDGSRLLKKEHQIDGIKASISPIGTQFKKGGKKGKTQQN